MGTSYVAQLIQELFSHTKKLNTLRTISLRLLHTLVSLAAVFSLVTQRSSPQTRLWGGALRDETKNGCEGDYSYTGFFSKTVIKGKDKHTKKLVFKPSWLEKYTDVAS